jgi:POT family proton-dependent oligopeptide transporter
MGLSLVSKLSPPRITAMMMGGWSLATSLGNKLSGILAKMWDTYDDKAIISLSILRFDVCNTDACVDVKKIE